MHMHTHTYTFTLEPTHKHTHTQMYLRFFENKKWKEYTSILTLSDSLFISILYI